MGIKHLRALAVGFSSNPLSQQPCISFLLEYLSHQMNVLLALNAGDGFSLRLQKSQTEKNQGQGVIFLKRTLISRASYHLEELCVCHLNVFGHQCPRICSFQKHLLLLGFQTSLGFKETASFTAVLLQKWGKNMEKRHQNPSISYFWGFYR